MSTIQEYFRDFDTVSSAMRELDKIREMLNTEIKNEEDTDIV